MANLLVAYTTLFADVFTNSGAFAQLLLWNFFSNWNCSAVQFLFRQKTPFRMCSVIAVQNHRYKFKNIYGEVKFFSNQGASTI